MKAQDAMETLTERIPDSLRDVATDVDRVARAAAERAQAEAIRAFDSRFESERRATERRAAERRQKTAGVAVVMALLIVGVAIVLVVAQRRRSRRLQRIVRSARRAWNRSSDRGMPSSADEPRVPPVPDNGTGTSAGGQWQEQVAQPATTTLEVERA